MISDLSLRKVEESDIIHFSKWWRDHDLIRFTSGVDYEVSDNEVRKYFDDILNDNIDYHFMIVLDEITIGYISLSKKDNEWYETQIVIGDSRYLGQGYGTKAIMQLIDKAKEYRIHKIFLEVRPTNDRAIKAYLKCGFRKNGIIKHDNKFMPETLRMEITT